MNVPFLQNTNAPARVKRVTVMMLSYALAILISTVWFALQTDFSNKQEFIRGIVRVAGMAYLAWWLLKLDKRAWWFAVAACGLLTVFGIAGVIIVGSVGLMHDTSVFTLLLRFVLPIYLLAHATLILLQKETRAYFFR